MARSVDVGGCNPIPLGENPTTPRSRAVAGPVMSCNRPNMGCSEGAVVAPVPHAIAWVTASERKGFARIDFWVCLRFNDFNRSSDRTVARIDGLPTTHETEA